jgi:hypothetical protein
MVLIHIRTTRVVLLHSVFLKLGLYWKHLETLSIYETRDRATKFTKPKQDMYYTSSYYISVIDSLIL